MEQPCKVVTKHSGNLFQALFFNIKGTVYFFSNGQILQW